MFFAFVILHYQEFEMTCTCVESILKLKNNIDRLKVYVVDNASPNKSGILLHRRFDNNNDVEVLISDNNLGFAKGNNLGYIMAKKENADFIVLMNNDITIDDSDFLKKISHSYTTKKWGVLGPDILSVKDGVHQNPMHGYIKDKNYLNIQIIKTYIRKYMALIGFNKIAMRRKNKSYSLDHFTKDQYIDGQNGTILQGSFLIFSSHYINAYDGLYDGTFMYYEEAILAYRCLKNEIPMYYTKDIQVNHFRNISNIKLNPFVIFIFILHILSKFF